MQALPQRDPAPMEVAPSEHRQLAMASASCSRRNDAALHIERVWLRSSDVGVRICLEGATLDHAFAFGNCTSVKKQKVCDLQLIQHSQDGSKLRQAGYHRAAGNATYETLQSISRSSNLNVAPCSHSLGTQEHLAMRTFSDVPEVEMGSNSKRHTSSCVCSQHRSTKSVQQRNNIEPVANESKVYPPARGQEVLPPSPAGAIRSPDDAQDTRELMGTLLEEVDADDSREDAEVRNACVHAPVRPS
eukprot:679514-Pleurochrysis_carterae.AAC.1